MQSLTSWFMKKKHKERAMTALDFRVKMIMDKLSPELIAPVTLALQHSDGTLLSFQQELSMQIGGFSKSAEYKIMDLVAHDAD
jgi:hypothetical protein